MALHFTTAEFAERRARVCRAMIERGFDGLLLFQQESLYYLTGFDTFGWVFFQCLVLSADGRMTLLTRAPDLRQARATSVIDDIRIWVDESGAAPARALRAVLVEYRYEGSRLGVEWQAYGLNAALGRDLEQTLDGFCALADASDLVTRLRLVKSTAEVAYIRRASALADAAFDAAVAETRPGADTAVILAAMQNAVLAAGGDYPANPFIIGAGHDALLCRYHTGRPILTRDDQLTLEWAGVFRHYHACMMRTFIVGQASAPHQTLHGVAREALTAALVEMRPGQPAMAAFEAQAAVLDAAGLRPHRLNACGYSLGATFPPHWMDWPMLYAGQDIVFDQGMVFFVHIIIADSDRGVAMTLGQTVHISESGAEFLTRAPFTLLRI